MALVHGCSELHAAAWRAAGVSPLSSAQGCLCFFLCHLQFTSSSFSLWPVEFCLGLCPDLLIKQRAEKTLSEEVLHVSGCFRHVCSRRPSLLISLVFNSCKARNSGQLLTLLSVLPCWSTCYLQMRSHIPPFPCPTTLEPVLSIRV